MESYSVIPTTLKFSCTGIGAFIIVTEVRAWQLTVLSHRSIIRLKFSYIGINAFIVRAGTDMKSYIASTLKCCVAVLPSFTLDSIARSSSITA